MFLINNDEALDSLSDLSDSKLRFWASTKSHYTSDLKLSCVLMKCRSTLSYATSRS